jgi:hypothetical protein
VSKLIFNRKKASVIPELRPMFKIGKLLLILKLCCSGGKASLLKLHLFNWAMLEPQRMKALQLSAEKKELVLGVWGIDPGQPHELENCYQQQITNKYSPKIKMQMCDF